jgi:SAM-dependent methyltransferase
MRTPIRISPDPMYAELEVHRTMIRDEARTEAFRRAIEVVVRPGDVVLDVGAGSGILSLFAARAGAARVYAVEATSVASVARELAVANGYGDVVQVFQGDAMEIELPEQVDVIVSEWLGGFGIDEGMLVPVIVARDRWLRPGGTMIPRTVTTWTSLVHDRYVGDHIGFLRSHPYGLDLSLLADLSVHEIIYAGTFRHLAKADQRSEPALLWSTDTESVTLDVAQSPHEAQVTMKIQKGGTANALALWFNTELAPEVELSVGPGDPHTHWGMTTAPLNAPVDLETGTTVHAKVRTAMAQPVGTWTRWSVAFPDTDWEHHDEQTLWEEVDD